MAELKIRTIRSERGEAESRFAVIDTFENVYIGRKYNCACEVFQPDYKHAMCKRGNEIKEKRLRFDIEACSDDVFERVDIPMYLGLSQALKASGYVFNKKLAKLYKNYREKKRKG